MKILLVNPPTCMHVVTPPLSLGYLASNIKNHEVKIIDSNKENLNVNKTVKKILDLKPDVLGLTSFTMNYSEACQIISKVKDMDKEITTALGGYHASALPRQVLAENKDVDYVFAGESEISFSSLIEKIGNDNKKGIEKIHGLCYRNSKSKICANKISILKNLDSLPFPAWNLIQPQTYPRKPHGVFIQNYPIAPIVTSRGCPFKCNFCSIRCVHGRSYRARSIDNVIKEIEYLINEFGIKEIHIEDENFILYRRRVIKFCKMLIEKKIEISWSCPNGVRIDTLNRDLLKLMKMSGCFYLAFGIESGSKKMQNLMKKNLNLKTVEKIIKLTNEVGIKTQGFFIIGYPGETEKSIEQTIQFSKKLLLDRAAFLTFVPLPGSQIYDELSKNGLLKSINWKRYKVSMPFYVGGIEGDEIKKYCKKAFLSFYLRPKISLNLLRDMKIKDLSFYWKNIEEYLF